MALDKDNIEEGDMVRVERVMNGAPEVIVDWVGEVQTVSEDGECKIAFSDGSFWYLWAEELAEAA